MISDSFKLKLVPIVFLFLSHNIFSQTYAPGVGIAGTSAMNKDSNVFINWANGCKIIRGYLDISQTALGFTNAGDSSMACGKAQSNGMVSLGDGGMATCTFPYAIMDGPSYDFAVFENSFDDSFLELAFVEVSSDGINFVRFKSHSLTDSTIQTGTFGSTNPTKINNLAGKYKGGYGTPFDLQELALYSNLQINNITHVRIVDVIGSIQKQYATRDSYRNKVNDPFPTPFASGGFDLDAIGVIHQNILTRTEKEMKNSEIKLFPNPAAEILTVHGSWTNNDTRIKVLITNSLGQIVKEDELILENRKANLDIKNLEQGIYFLKIEEGNRQWEEKLIIKY